MKHKTDEPPLIERRATRRTTDDRWRTALTCIEPNKIMVRGYPLDEMMGRLTFGEAIYLLLMGEVPSPGDRQPDGGDARLVHRSRRDATIHARGAQHRDHRRGAAGLRRVGRSRVRPLSRRRHRVLHALPRRRDSISCAMARPTARPPSRSSTKCRASDEPIPGFGHRFHTRDPRAARLFQMALELEVEGEHVQMIRAVEMLLDDATRPTRRCRSTSMARSRPSAATSGSRRTSPTPSSSSRACPGLAAHAREESERHAPMRQIDPKDHVYDGPSERRLPDRRSR